MKNRFTSVLALLLFAGCASAPKVQSPIDPVASIVNTTSMAGRACCAAMACVAVPATWADAGGAVLDTVPAAMSARMGGTAGRMRRKGFIATPSGQQATSAASGTVRRTTLTDGLCQNSLSRFRLLTPCPRCDEHSSPHASTKRT